MPTAMPVAPLTSRLGIADGRTLGSVSVSSKLGMKSTVFLFRSARISSGGRGETRLGVAHGGRRIAIDRAEVALSIHEHGAHGEILRHARHGFVDGRVAMRMVLAEHLADDACGLLVGRSRRGCPCRTWHTECGAGRA